MAKASTPKNTVKNKLTKIKERKSTPKIKPKHIEKNTLSFI